MWYRITTSQLVNIVENPANDSVRRFNHYAILLNAFDKESSQFMKLKRFKDLQKELGKDNNSIFNKDRLELIIKRSIQQIQGKNINQEDLKDIIKTFGPLIQPGEWITELESGKLIEKIRRQFDLGKLYEILDNNPEVITNIISAPNNLVEFNDIIENLNQIKASNWSDFFKQSMKGVQGFGSYTKSAQPVLDALQKFSPYVKMLGYADLSIELIKLITKLGSGSSVDVRDWMTLFSKICQQPPFASLAGPLGPAFIAAGFIAEPLIYPTYDVGLAYENQTESDIKEVESDSISMDHTQWDHWLKISAELRRLEKTLPVIAMRRAILNPILKTKFSSAYREADKIIQDNMNGGRSNTEAIKRTFYPLLHEYFDIKERKYQRTRV